MADPSGVTDTSSPGTVLSFDAPGAGTRFGVLGIWVATQVFMVAMPDLGPIAWWAHIGGLIAGAVLIVFMRRPGVPLFDRGAKLA